MDTPRSALLKYFHNTSWLLVGRVGRMALNVGVGIVVARYLGPVGYGDLNFAVSFVALFSCLSDMGLESILLRDLVQMREGRDALLGTAFGMRLVGAIVQMALAVSMVLLLEHGPALCPLVAVVALGVLFHPFQVIVSFLHSEVRGRHVALTEFLASGVNNALRIGLVLAGSALIWFGWSIALEAAVMAAVLVWFYKAKGLRLRQWRFVGDRAKTLLGEAWPLILSGVMVMLYMRIDQVMIMEMAGPDAVGLYAAAVRISEILYFVPLLMVNSVSPALINARKTSQAHFEHRMQQLLDFLFVFSVAVAIPMSLGGDFLIALAFGEAYGGAGPSLTILAWTGVFVSLGVASGQWLIIENLQIWSMYRTACGVVVNIALNCYAIPRYGIEGAAVSTVISYAMAVYFCMFPVQKLRLLRSQITRTLMLHRLWRRNDSE